LVRRGLAISLMKMGPSFLRKFGPKTWLLKEKRV
jgi:hypothetical protein